MREIKFRYVFRRKSDGHIYIIGLDIEGVEQKTGELRVMFENDLWELIARDQWTSLKDKHGRDIYDGDIIEDKYDLDVVSWVEGIGAWGWSGGIEWGTIFPDGVDVIGNIHENPELLK